MVTWNTFCDPGVLTQTLSSLGGGLDTGIISGNFSSIFGGQNNTVTGNCSAIFGGTGNNDGGLNYVGIFGQSVTGVISNAFHAENLVAQNMPLYSGGPLPFPAGSKALYYQIIGGSCYVMIA